MNKSYTYIDFYKTIQEFNKIMPLEMSEQWQKVLFECFECDNHKYIIECRNLIYEYEYSVIMKNPCLIIPRGIYFIMLDKIQKCRDILTAEVRKGKMKAKVKRRQEYREREEKQKTIKKLDQGAKIIEELYK